MLLINIRAQVMAALSLLYTDPRIGSSVHSGI